MGGAATVCIQYEDGTRDSYMGYNRGMAIILNHSEILTAKDGERDAIAKPLFEREKEHYSGDYFSDTPGLAPEWYGLNFIDLKKKRIWFCQGQNNIPTYNTYSLGSHYADDYNENVMRLAELGMLRYQKDKNKHWKIVSEAQKPNLIIEPNLPLVTVKDVQKAFDNKISGFCSFVVFAPGWDYGDLIDEMGKMYELIKSDYDLTVDEVKRWDVFIKDEDDEEDEDE